MVACTAYGFSKVLFCSTVLSLVLAWSPPALSRDLSTRAPVPLFESVSIPGLSHESVQSIVQDQEGFLWFGTWDGLDRWDGLEVVSFTHDPDDPMSLSNSGIAALLTGQDGQLWIASLEGIDRFDPNAGQFRHYELPLDFDPEQRPNTFRWALFESSDGAIWAGSSDGLFVLPPETDYFEQVNLSENGRSVESTGVIQISEDELGTLWMLKSGGWPLSEATMYRAERRSAEPASLEVTTMRLEEPRSVSFLLDQQGQFWAGSTVARFLNQTEMGFVDSVTGIEPVPTSAHLHDRSGRVWIGTFFGLYLADSNKKQAQAVPLGDRSGFLDDYVLSIFEDHAGAIWVTTIAGVYRHDPAVKAFSSLAENPKMPGMGLTSNRVASIARDHQGNLWVGTWGSGIDRVDADTGEITNFPVSANQPGGLPQSELHLVLFDEQGQMWVAAGNHICKYLAGETIFECMSPAEATDSDTFWNLVATPFGSFLLASNNLGLVEYDPRQKLFRRHLEDMDFSKSIQAMIVADDALWLVDIQANLIRYNLGDMTAKSFGQLLVNHGRSHSIRGVNDIQADSDGSLWIGTSEGLLHFDPQNSHSRLFTRSDGLPGSHVYSILADQKGQLWGGTNRGLIRIDKRADTDVHIADFNRSDGVSGMEFNRRARFRAANGLMYFGSKEGITWFDPEAITDNDFLPPLALSQVSVSGLDGSVRSIPATTQEFELGPQDHAIYLQFAALSFTHSERNQFRYRMENLDENWVEAGTRRFATYTSLPPGDYAFHLQGSNNDGVWNETSLVARISVLPPFWATWWFRSLIFVGLIVLFSLIYRWRVARLIEIERLRVRIAGDLHDDLSSDLSGIALTMDLLESSDTLSSSDKKRVNQVRTTAINMIDGVRDLVWYLDSGHDSIESLWQKMRQVAETMLAGREVRMSMTGPDKPVLINMNLRKHIYLIYKEILHNIVKHSEADHVIVNLNLSGNRLNLRIEDDGIGMPAANDSNGFGIENLQRRSERVDGDLKIESTRNIGTIVSFSVNIDHSPGRIAV